MEWHCDVYSSSRILSQLALARVGVGIGEAGFSAIAVSVIADYHSNAERNRAVSILMLAIPISGVLSSLMGGWINQEYGWRTAFLVAGVPGLALSLLVKGTVHEPPRGAMTSATLKQHQPSLQRVLGTLWRRRSLRHLLFAQALANIAFQAIGWVAVFFIRRYGMSTGEVGMWLALIGGLGGGAGIWLSGYLTTRFGSHDARVQVRFLTVASALFFPVAVTALWCPWELLAFLIWIPTWMLGIFFLGIVLSLVQGLCATNMRATMASLFILIQVLAGGVIGFQLVGLLSDAITPAVGSSGLALQWAMTLTVLATWWAAVHFRLAERSIRQDMAEAVEERAMALGSMT